jgi:hypothetical protein
MLFLRRWVEHNRSGHPMPVFSLIIFYKCLDSQSRSIQIPPLCDDVGISVILSDAASAGVAPAGKFFENEGCKVRKGFTRKRISNDLTKRCAAVFLKTAFASHFFVAFAAFA